MIFRARQGTRPQVTFTADFHELVQGDLVPGPCVLRYDPLRLVRSRAEAAEHRIEAHVRLHPMGTEWHKTLRVPAGAPLAALDDPAGQGYMLETEFTIPDGCDEIEAWFSCRRPDGHVDWDSEFGHNYWMRFPLHDLRIDGATVRSSDRMAAFDTLDVAVTSVAKVDSIRVRYRPTSTPPVGPGSGPGGAPTAIATRHSAPLQCIAFEGTQKRWAPASGGIHLPHGATIAFDLVYIVGAHEHTDDNQGSWYVAD
jgi:hypothetical protein